MQALATTKPVNDNFAALFGADSASQHARAPGCTRDERSRVQATSSDVLVELP